VTGVREARSSTGPTGSYFTGINTPTINHTEVNDVDLPVTPWLSRPSDRPAS
jgi:hypothetical protein